MSKEGKIIVLLSMLIVLLLIAGTISYSRYIEYKREEKFFITTKNSFSKFYKDLKNEVPEDNLDIREIEKVEKKINNIERHEEEKRKYLLYVKRLKKYYLVKKDIDAIYKNGILNSNVTAEQIEKINSSFSNLSKKYQNYLIGYIDDINQQKDNIDNIENEILSLFFDAEKQQLKENITKEQVISLKNKLTVLKQADLVDLNNKYLDNALTIINVREENERKRKEQEIKDAWVILNVPYISQNNNGVLNGCEAASLLMGLQYKGYLSGMTLTNYSTTIPKSLNNNAYEGFTHDIFGLEPTNVPHWIAPSPLANYGRTSSGNNNVIDGTGLSLTDLDNEIVNNNPVVIYATSKFKTPKEWVEGAPKNIHVMLLTGYNKITGQQIITDPWTHSDGRTKWTLSKQQLESVYNAVGKKSVIIR